MNEGSRRRVSASADRRRVERSLNRFFALSLPECDADTPRLSWKKIEGDRNSGKHSSDKTSRDPPLTLPHRSQLDPPPRSASWVICHHLVFEDGGEKEIVCVLFFLAMEQNKKIHAKKYEKRLALRTCQSSYRDRNK